VPGGPSGFQVDGTLMCAGQLVNSYTGYCRERGISHTAETKDHKALESTHPGPTSHSAGVGSVKRNRIGWHLTRTHPTSFGDVGLHKNSISRIQPPSYLNTWLNTFHRTPYRVAISATQRPRYVVVASTHNFRQIWCPLRRSCDVDAPRSSNSIPLLSCIAPGSDTSLSVDRWQPAPCYPAAPPHIHMR
jgi:hypothetical protein